MNKETPTDNPKVVLLDAESHDGQQSGYFEYQETIQTLQGQGFPIYLRVVALVFASVLSAIALCLAAVTCMAVLLFLLTLGMSTPIKNMAAKVWLMLRKCLVFTLGLFLAVFNPSFGLGIIALYFMLRGEKMDINILPMGRVF